MNVNPSIFDPSSDPRPSSHDRIFSYAALVACLSLALGSAQLLAQAVPIGGDFAISQSTTQCLINHRSPGQ